MGCVEGSPEEAELAMLTDIIEAYEGQRMARTAKFRAVGLAADLRPFGSDFLS